MEDLIIKIGLFGGGGGGRGEGGKAGGGKEMEDGLG